MLTSKRACDSFGWGLEAQLAVKYFLHSVGLIMGLNAKLDRWGLPYNRIEVIVG